MCPISGSSGEDATGVRVRLVAIEDDTHATQGRRLGRQPGPALLVPLEHEDELQPSLDAVRFMYTGSLAPAMTQQGQVQKQQQAHSVSAGELVRIRRQAEYLQVHGCTEACDAALVEWFKQRPIASGGNSSASTTTATASSPGSPLAPVLELYSCRHLLPSEEEDARVGPILSACGRYLVGNWGAPLPDGEHQPSKAEVLAWLLGGGDAVRIANDPQLLQLWYSLPAAALEELLPSDHLSTDDEATVVLLVEMWVAAKGSAVTEADKARVRRQLRLVNCSTSYLFDVLPKLPWLGAQQAAFLARCRMTDRSKWQQHGSQMGGYDTSSPWYSQPRPQSVPEEGVSYRWEVSREDLLAALPEKGGNEALLVRFKHADCNSRGNNSSVIALGFGWSLEVTAGETDAGLYVQCHSHAAVTGQAGKLHGGASVSLSVVVCSGVAGEETLTLSNEMVTYGGDWGWPEALPLEQSAEPTDGGQQQQQQQGAGGQAAGGGEKTDEEVLAPWAKLLGSEGKMRGVLTFYRPETMMSE